MKMYLRALVCASLFASTSAFAARSVSISVPGASPQLKLTNPSAVTVTFDYECVKNDGGVASSATGQTLAPKNSMDLYAGIADSGKCAGNANPLAQGTGSDGPFYLCPGAGNYATANSRCGTGNKFCFPKGASSLFCSTMSEFWVKRDDVQVSPSCTWVPVSGGNAVSAGNYCSSAPNISIRLGSDMATNIWPGHERPETDSVDGATCCSAPVNAAFCKITITSTDSAAHLVSPAFKGGSPF